MFLISILFKVHSLFVNIPQASSLFTDSVFILLSFIHGPIWYWLPPRPSLPRSLHIFAPPHLCGVGCYTSAVLTLTAPSLWRLISCSDTLSLCHVNGPAYLPACVYAISTLSKALENRESQIRESQTHTACCMCVWTTESERDNVCIWNKRSGGSAREWEGCKKKYHQCGEGRL